MVARFYRARDEAGLGHVYDQGTSAGSKLMVKILLQGVRPSRLKTTMKTIVEVTNQSLKSDPIGFIERLEAEAVSFFKYCTSDGDDRKEAGNGKKRKQETVAKKAKP